MSLAETEAWVEAKASGLRPSSCASGCSKAGNLFKEMTNISRAFGRNWRRKLASPTWFSRRRRFPRTGHQVLFKLDDGHFIETCSFRREGISPLHLFSGRLRHGVSFLPDGEAGAEEKSHAAEMLTRYPCQAFHERTRCLTNIVFMGMGEPLRL